MIIVRERVVAVEALEAVGLMVVLGVCVCSMLAPLLLAIFERSFLGQESAGDGAECGDSDDE